MGILPADLERTILRMYGEKGLREAEESYRWGIDTRWATKDEMDVVMRSAVDVHRVSMKDPFDVKV